MSDIKKNAFHTKLRPEFWAEWHQEDVQQCPIENQEYPLKFFSISLVKQKLTRREADGSDEYVDSIETDDVRIKMQHLTIYIFGFIKNTLDTLS